MIFITLFCLIINVYLIYKDKKKSILLFLLLLPIYITVRRVCYFNVFFVKVTFETIYITVLFISNLKGIFNTAKRLFLCKNNMSFKFIFMILAFFIFCVNSNFYSNNTLNGLSEVYIGVLIPIMLMMCIITYFERKDKYNIYYVLIIAIDFSCIYGFVQLLIRGISFFEIKTSKAFLTFGFNNVNIFAGILVAILPLLIEMILYKKNTKIEKLFLYFSFMLYSISTVITFSRGAWFCYIGIMFISLCSKRYIKVFFAILIPLILAAKPIFSYIINRGTTTSFLSNESAVARIQSIFTGFVIMKKYLFGIGGGNFAEAYKKFSLDGYFAIPEYIRYKATVPSYALENAHNLLLQIGIEFGIVSACIFIFIIINRFRASFVDFNYSRGAFISILIYFIFSLVTGNEFDHKGIITGTIIMFVMFGVIELSLKNRG